MTIFGIKVIDPGALVTHLWKHPVIPARRVTWWSDVCICLVWLYTFSCGIDIFNVLLLDFLEGRE